MMDDPLTLRVLKGGSWVMFSLCVIIRYVNVVVMVNLLSGWKNFANLKQVAAIWLLECAQCLMAPRRL